MLKQRINTYLAILLIGSLGFAASFFIINASRADQASFEHLAIPLVDE